MYVWMCTYMYYYKVQGVVWCTNSGNGICDLE